MVTYTLYLKFKKFINYGNYQNKQYYEGAKKLYDMRLFIFYNASSIYLDSLGCFANNVISSVQDNTMANAAMCRFSSIPSLVSS